jgi:3-dehydroquinate synthase
MAEKTEITVRGASGSVSRIVFEPLSGLDELVDPAKSVLVTDAEIRRLHGAAFPPCLAALVERGEAAKSLASLEELYGRFLELGLGRDGTVLAVGGGAISDLAGFAAATWMRGVDFGFAPTTLLAMVDAAVGGKNGVDFRGVKNLVGSFSQPRFVLMDVSTLSTLSDLEFASGMAEVVKHAVISGGPYFELVESLAEAELRSPRPSRDELERLVAGSVEIKAGIVNRDEREAGARRLLNLGHTVGHGVEAATGLPHGHSVAAGLGTVCRLAVRRGRLAPVECDRITRLLDGLGLPSSIAAAAEAAAVLGHAAAPGLPAPVDGPDLRAAVIAAIDSDKKRVGSDILMAIPGAIGSVAIEAVPLPDLRAFVMEAP